MKIFRKAIAVILIILVILLLPLSVILKNADEVLFSPDVIWDLVDEHIVNSEVIYEPVQSYVRPMISDVELEPVLRLNWVKAWDGLSENEFDSVLDSFQIIEGITPIAKDTIYGLFDWLGSKSSEPIPEIELVSIKENLVSQDELITDSILSPYLETFSACSPEETEFLLPLPLTATVSKDFEETNYRVDIVNPNSYISYELDGMRIGILGDDDRLKSFKVPSCFQMVGRTFKPSVTTNVFSCYLEASAGLADQMNNSLEFSTTKIEPKDWDPEGICAPPYDETLALMVPQTTEITESVAEKIPNEIQIMDIPSSKLVSIKEQISQGRLVAQFGWIAVSVVLLLAALIAVGFSKKILGWLGWPLLIAGGILIVIALQAKVLLGLAWTSLSPLFIHDVPSYLAQPLEAIFDALFTLISAPVMQQALIILGTALVALVLSFLLREKTTEKQVED
ncbi:MAG: hypothetical protein GY755_04195 [Chloroflexi bacterium]|nr:hypothetical protein [Chloroflexota bacterium]